MHQAIYPKDDSLGHLVLDFDNLALQERVKILGFLAFFSGASLFLVAGSIGILADTGLKDVPVAMLIGSLILYFSSFLWWHSLPRDGPFLKIWEKGLEIPTPKDKMGKRFLPFTDVKGLSFEKTSFADENIFLLTEDAKIYLPVPYKKGCSKADLFKELNALLAKSQNGGENPNF